MIKFIFEIPPRETDIFAIYIHSANRLSDYLYHEPYVN